MREVYVYDRQIDPADATLDELYSLVDDSARENARVEGWSPIDTIEGIRIAYATAGSILEDIQGSRACRDYGLSAPISDAQFRALHAMFDDSYGKTIAIYNAQREREQHPERDFSTVRHVRLYKVGERRGGGVYEALDVTTGRRARVEARDREDARVKFSIPERALMQR